MWTSYLEDLDRSGTVFLVKVGWGGGGGGGLEELRMADGLVEVENQKGSGITTEILEAGSNGVQTRSNNDLPEILIPSWLLAALETRRHRLDFLSTASFESF